MECRQARHLNLIMAVLGALWLGVFTLWQDLSYAHITRAKWIGALCLCALCVVTAVPVTIVALRREGRRSLRPHPALWLALGYFLWVALSAWQGSLSGQLNSRGEPAVLMDAIRYEGLYTHLCYGLIFFSMNVHPARLRPVLWAAAAALALFMGLVALQYTGVNPLGLYPSGRSIYANYEFQGTIGNIDMVSGYLCIVMPLLLMGYLLKGGPALLAGGLGCVLLMTMMEVQSGLIATALLCGLLLAVMLFRPETRCQGLIIFCGLAAMLALRKAIYLPWLDGGLRTEAPVTLSFGRTSAMLLSLSIVFACAALLLRAHPGPALSGRAVLALIAVFVIAVVSVLAFAPIPESMGGVYEIHEMLCGRARDEYGSWRVGAWRNALAIWKENPVFGTGPDTYYYALHNRLEATGEVLGENFDNPHNEYLAILSNNGFPALLCYLGLLFTVLLSCLRLGLRESWLWALGASILCYAAQGFFSFSICLVTPMFWAVLGMTCAHIARQKRLQSAPQHATMDTRGDTHADQLRTQAPCPDGPEG